MRKNLKSSLLLLIPFLLLLSFFGCHQEKDKSSAHRHASEEYTCPMHPQVIQKEPGSCPVCGMDLVTKNRQVAGTKADVLVETVEKGNSISANKTVKPFRKTIYIGSAVNGVITYDTRQSFTIPVRFSGRIEKLLIQYNLQPIKKGEKILEIYSPELVTAQKELLFVIKHDNENKALIERAKQKLRLLGATDGQINQLIKSQKEIYSFPVYSPYSGYVVEENSAAAPSASPVTSASSPAGEMGGMAFSGFSANPSQGARMENSPLQLREGMYVNTGQTLFKVINTDKIWAEFNADQDGMLIRKEDSVTIIVGGLHGKKIKAKVSLVQPFFQEGEGFSKVRVYLENKDKSLKVGELVMGDFKTKVENGLWVPQKSVVYLGRKSVVFEKTLDGFKAKKVTTGRKANELIEVVEGLSETAELAENAQFIADSESFIRVDE